MFFFLFFMIHPHLVKNNLFILIHRSELLGMVIFHWKYSIQRKNNFILLSIRSASQQRVVIKNKSLIPRVMMTFVHIFHISHVIICNSQFLVILFTTKSTCGHVCAFKIWLKSTSIHNSWYLTMKHVCLHVLRLPNHILSEWKKKGLSSQSKQINKQQNDD